MCDIKQKTLLLVDDEIVIAMKEKTDLEDYGYNVIVANNGEDAIRIFKENRSIDLILMDIDLGKGSDGTQTAKIMLKERSIPIIFLSCHSEPEFVGKTESITSYGYVVKNLIITVLDASIKMAFRLFDANRKLTEAEERYHSIFENAPVGIFHSTTKGKIIDANNEFVRIMGYNSPEEMVEVVNRSSVDKTLYDHPEERENHIKDAGVNPGQWIKAEQKYHRKDGTSITANLIMRILPGNIDYIEGFVVDITERKLAEEFLTKSELRLNKIVSNIADVIGIIGKEGYITYISPNIEKVFGWTAEDSYGKEKLLRAHPDDKNKMEEAVNYLFEKDNALVKIEYRVLCKNGCYKYVNAIGFSRRNDPDINGVLFTLQDIDEHKLSEEKINNLIKEKEILLKEVHHRITNTLNTVSSLLNIKASEMNDKTSIQAFQDMSKRINTLGMIYRNLVQTDDYKFISTEDYLSPLIDNIISVFPNSKNVKIEKKIESFSLDSKIATSIGLMTNEIITNSFKYAFPGSSGGKISIITVEGHNKYGNIR